MEGLNGFFNGYTGMLLRDAPGFAWYFFCYEFLKRYFTSFDNQDSTILSKLSFSLAGGLTGVSTWMLFYPADNLKTRLQTAKPGSNPGVFRLANQIYQEHGFLRLYKGVHVQLISAFPRNSASMLVFEQAKQFFG